MRVWSGLLVAAGLAALSGCRVFERWSNDRDRDRPLFGEPASRTRDRDRDADRDTARPPRNWLDNPTLSVGGVPAGPASDLRDATPGLRGVLAGQVVDSDGRGASYLDIQIDVTDPAQNGGAPVVAQTDRDGYFSIQGLKANQSYTLTAQTRQGGHTAAAQFVTRTPNPRIRMQLRDDVTLPPARTGADLPPSGVPGGPSFPPANSIPGGPPSLFDAPSTGRSGGSSAPTPIPLSKDGGTRDTGVLPYPAENTPGDGAFSPVPPAPAKPAPIPTPKPPSPRSELIAPGPYPENRPPVVNIPGPAVSPEGALIPPPTPPSTSKYPAAAGGEFSLVDPLGRPRAFPAGRAGELVLLDFMTTTCAPCRRAVPALTALQAGYGAKGLEVIGVACDDAAEATRRESGTKYADEHRLNYLVYTEPGAAPGKVMNRFGVTVFPTLVLIDGSGAVLWQGRAGELDVLERVIQGAVK
jgi:thiol-disulfide isomerase/thioredoxin